MPSFLMSLRSAGIPDDVKSYCNETALFIAAKEGCVDCFHALLRVNGERDIDVRHELTKDTPLIRAVDRQSVNIIEALVKSGADVGLSNLIGEDAFEVASVQRPSLQKLKSLQIAGRRQTPRTRRRFLREAIQTTLSKLLSTSPSDVCDEAKTEDLTFLAACTLLKLKTEASRAHATPLLFQVMYPSEEKVYRFSFSCRFCGRYAADVNMCLCVTCFSVSLCHSCYESLRLDDAEKDFVFEAFNKIELLEKRVKSLRACIQYFHPSSLVLLQRAIATFRKVTDWIEETWKEYQNWDETYNSRGYFQAYKRPGYHLLKILKETEKLIEDSPPGERFTEDELATITELQEKLYDLQLTYRADREWFEFGCAKHEWIETSHETTDELRKNRDIYDENGRLQKKWLETLVAYYAKPDVDPLTPLDTQSDAINKSFKPPAYDILDILKTDGLTDKNMSQSQSIANKMTQKVPKRAMTMPALMPIDRLTSADSGFLIGSKLQTGSIQTEPNFGIRRAYTEVFPSARFERIEVETLLHTLLSPIAEEILGEKFGTQRHEVFGIDASEPQTVRRSLSVMISPTDDESHLHHISMSETTQKGGKSVMKHRIHAKDELVVTAIMGSPVLTEEPRSVNEDDDSEDDYKNDMSYTLSSLAGQLDVREGISLLTWVIEVQKGDEMWEWVEDEVPENRTNDKEDEKNVKGGNEKFSEDHIPQQPLKEHKRLRMTVIFDSDDFEELTTVLAMRFADALFPGFSIFYLKLEKMKRMLDNLKNEGDDQQPENPDRKRKQSSASESMEFLRRTISTEHLPSMLPYMVAGLSVVAGVALLWTYILRSRLANRT